MGGEMSDQEAEEGHEGFEYVRIVVETEKAILFEFPDRERWLPKSQIEVDKELKRVWVVRWLLHEMM